jgi:hypothetical protein
MTRTDLPTELAAQRRQFTRSELKKLPSDQAIELLLLNLPAERQGICLAGWDAIQQVMDKLDRGGYTMNPAKVDSMLQVLTEDIPDLIWLSPDDAMPPAFKQLFRSWISLIEHSLPREKLRSPHEKDRMEVQTLIAGMVEATRLLARAFDYFEVRPAKEPDPK